MALETTTVSKTWALLFAHFEELLGTISDGSIIAIRSVYEADAPLDFHPTASLSVRLQSMKTISRSNSDKQWQCELFLRVITVGTTAEGMTVEMASKIAQVEDKMEAFTKPVGVTGFEDGLWNITNDTTSERGNLVIGSSVRNFTVKVLRGQN